MSSESVSSSAAGALPAKTLTSISRAHEPDPQLMTNHDSNPFSDDTKVTTTSNPLQVAAQQYPWMYMTSTLDACFKDAEKTAQHDTKARSDALDQEEAIIEDHRVRFEAEQLIEFYDELSSDKFAKDAPKIMQIFNSHGDACTKLEAEALHIATKDLSNIDYDSMDIPLREYNDVLDRLGRLLEQAFELESAIIRLTVSTTPSTESVEVSKTEAETEFTEPSDSTSLPEGKSVQSTAARSQIAPIFSACLPIVRARAGNIAMAQQLVEGAKQNLSMTLHLESLGIGSEDDGDYDEDEYDEN